MTDEIKSTAEEQDKTLSADIEKTSTAAEQEKYSRRLNSTE